MKKISLVLLITTMQITFLSAQENVNIYTQQDGKSVKVLVDNKEVIPVSIVLSLDLKGMKSTLERDRGTIIVPAMSTKYEVATATTSANAREMSFGMESSILAGDITKEHDRDVVYQLPIKPEVPVQIYQGYDGKFSHQGEYALDFGLEVGDDVYAARGGIVSKVVEKHSKGCKRESCAKYNNVIHIYHDDGTFAEYIHLEENGALVEVGDSVNAGDLIGKSGNTGWSSGPHLHFMVFNFRGDKRVSIKTRFMTSKDPAVYLKEKEYYQR